MAFALLVLLLSGTYKIPELTVSAFFGNQHVNPVAFPVFPMVFVTIACGAISGFHATQSPLMARCMTSERQGKPVFYGAMIVEGVVALVWAAIAMSFYGGINELNSEMTTHQGNAAFIVNHISNNALGAIGGVLALLGVVAAPLTSGDTAFRSARLIISDFLNLNQSPLQNRLLISLPLFVVGYILTKVDFAIVWRYFAWSNQTLATIVLWTITAYLYDNRKPYWISGVPAVFMTGVVSSYFLIAPEGLALPSVWGYAGSLVISLLVTFLVFNKITGRNLAETPSA
jgi:carbon starvation protein CstA